MAIAFQNIEAVDGSRMTTFPADLDGQRIVCAISSEALQDNFDGNGVSPLVCFIANRSAIEIKAACLIE